MEPTPLTCPACGVHLARLGAVPWGTGEHTLPVAPFLCEHCGGLGIVDLETGTLTPTTLADWEPVRRDNPTLWQALMRERARILAREH